MRYCKAREALRTSLNCKNSWTAYPPTSVQTRFLWRVMPPCCTRAADGRGCRWQGLPVRSANDCLIAACAIEANEPLLARDRDFAQIARIEPRLKLIF